MERVQFQQEQMVLELKDLVEKKLFTKEEMKQILKKRTGFETTLVRRVAKKADFLRYIAYETDLEHLRRKRSTKLDLPPGPPTVSDYSLVRRQFNIFERALKRFKNDVGLWVQYIQLAKREGARTLVGRITARALQLHPNKAALYIIAASHELDNLSPSAARTLLQRGIRMNPESIDMWREYVRMELGFIENLRRRWDILGISYTKGKVDKGKGYDPSNVISLGLSNGAEPDDHDIGMVDANGINEIAAATEIDELNRDEGAEAQRQIMNGAIVKTVMTNAVEALPQIGLFKELKSVVVTYPSPVELRNLLLDHLHDLLRLNLPGDAQAARLLVERHITPELKGKAIVDGIQRANEELLANVRLSKEEEICQVYADFVEEWCQRAIDQHLKTYLIASLKGVIQQVTTSPSLLSAHIRLLVIFANGDKNLGAKFGRLIEKYTEKVPQAAQVWLARLDAARVGVSSAEDERALAGTWKKARNSVSGKEEDILKIVISYVTVVPEAIRQDTSDQTDQLTARWMQEVALIGRRYLTTGRVWQRLFEVIGNDRWEEGKERVLGVVYEEWRKKDGVSAAVSWAGWLMQGGRGSEGSDVVGCAMRGLGVEEREELERRWRALLDEQ
ncbi:hypothetical protein AGABI2DRAFT_185273 [Agaricus bisporus var. bisporus H97]|uniref:hypothetical protein n=1 Tax=Agaricus bisporus var. bisporus (strain H97 / ATCC MYA-4626 / FGSC 10389) TaxID=936046 RepID=UPI00029F4EE2|nr:hypothetical protein AGABI2DRAFT_185273 [Agaricus bisporus var. bisporus H97]EKV47284.1 hypothetical protein AGABI2DRAFT_185273 [Agaricus bisporus var. bisporus H97]